MANRGDKILLLAISYTLFRHSIFDRDLLRNRGPTSDFVVAIFAIVSRFGHKVALFILIAELYCLC